MLDVMSRGRLRVAFPLGTGMEYWANAVNPATREHAFASRSRSSSSAGPRTDPRATPATSTATGT